MEGQDEVLLEATARVLEAIYRGRHGEAARWLADLAYYASAKGMEEAYLRLLERLLSEAERGPGGLPRRLAEALDSRLERMREGPERLFLSELLQRAEEVKVRVLGRHMAPPETLKREAMRILKEALG